MLPLKNITPSLQIRFVVSCNKDKLLKLNIHLGNIINSVLEILKIININQWHFNIVKYRVNILCEKFLDLNTYIFKIQNIHITNDFFQHFFS